MTRLLLLCLVGCYTAPPSTTPPPPPTPPIPTPTTDPTPPSVPLKADGDACKEARECTSGTCEGLGCGDDTPGRCMPTTRMCTRDLRPYCGCDGVTFRTSGSCPGRRFSAKAECSP